MQFFWTTTKNSSNETIFSISSTWLLLQILLQNDNDVKSTLSVDNFDENYFTKTEQIPITFENSSLWNISFKIYQKINSIVYNFNRLGAIAGYLFSNEKTSSVETSSHIDFMHVYWNSTDPTQAFYYWTVGGSIDRSLSFLRQPDKWYRKWAHKSFDDLSETAQQFIKKFGHTLGWPPRTTNVRLSAINLWASCPIPLHTLNVDFWTIYSKQISISDAEISKTMPISDVFFSESHNNIWNKISRQRLFSNYRYKMRATKFASLSDEFQQIVEYFKYQTAGIILDTFDLNWTEVITMRTYLNQKNISNVINEPLFEFRVQRQTNIFNILCTKIQIQNDFKQFTVKTNFRFSKIIYKNYASAILLLNANDHPSIQTDIKNANQIFLNKTSKLNKSTTQQTQKSYEYVSNHLPQTGDASVEGIVKLANFRGFNLLGSRINSTFIFPSWGFLRVSVISSRNTPNIFEWKHSIYRTANKIKKPNAISRFVLDRYASLPFIPRTPSNSQQTRTTNNITGNQFKFWTNSFLLNNELTISQSLISNSFGTYMQHNDWSKAEWGSLNNVYRESVNRVKFKNNLPKIWHEMRVHFATLLNLKFHYNKQLTKFLPVFYQKKGIAIFKTAEMQLYFVLLRARMALTPRSSMDLVYANLVYINHRTVTNPKIQVVRFDFIQLVVSAKYFVYFRWLHSWMLIKRNRLMPRVIMIADARRSERPKRISYPKWIVRNRYLDEDVPRYMEVDFISMTIAILQLPLASNEFDTFLMRHLNVYAPKMLNWKFIT